MPLPNGSVAWFELQDLELVASRRWHRHTAGSGYYVRSYNHGIYTYLHRLLMNAKPGQVVDHRDGDAFNNRRSNLRVCTQTQNKRNNAGKCKRRFQYKGLQRNKTGRWYAYIRRGDKRRYLGAYDTAIEAAQAYDRAAIEQYGEFARLNLPEAR